MYGCMAKEPAEGFMFISYYCWGGGGYGLDMTFDLKRWAHSSIWRANYPGCAAVFGGLITQGVQLYL